MSKNTRYSHLLFHIMSPELREQFFTDDEENFDAGWDLFETLHPEKAEVLVSLLEPHLEYVIKELKFQRDHNILLGKGDELGAARLAIRHHADKLDW
ncbi:hypothetical protein P7_210 [Pectobacterium phage vB_PcaM_P7_Pc]|nr:hypothetical protein P7_210 [Pectobacterium phage vB_PcaM_P7_Pc]